MSDAAARLHLHPLASPYLSGDLLCPLGCGLQSPGRLVLARGMVRGCSPGLGALAGVEEDGPRGGGQVLLEPRQLAGKVLNF